MLFNYIARKVGYHTPLLVRFGSDSHTVVIFKRVESNHTSGEHQTLSFNYLRFLGATNMTILFIYCIPRVWNVYRRWRNFRTKNRRPVLVVQAVNRRMYVCCIWPAGFSCCVRAGLFMHLAVCPSAKYAIKCLKKLLRILRSWRIRVFGYTSTYNRCRVWGGMNEARSTGLRISLTNTVSSIFFKI